MGSLFSFKGRMRPLPYAMCSLAAFLSQHLVVLLVLRVWGQPVTPDLAFYLAPLRTLVTHKLGSDLVLIAALAYLLLVAWVLAALAFRRAADANISEWVAAAAVAPIIQILAILALCLAPSRAAPPQPPAAPDLEAGPGWAAAAQGVVAGMALTLIAVAVGTLVFRVYGYGLFVVSPFVIGAITGYFVNRRADVGAYRTGALVAGATALGGIALVLAALEGLFCIILASPLGFGIALIGGLLGRAIALARRSTTTQSLSGLALLPIVFALEAAFPATTTFDTVQTVAVRAPAAAVWRAIVHMDTIDEQPALPFRLGVAYPVRGEVIGEGVGALRRGEFSTGTAIERVTEWVPEQKLAFVVVDDVPAMHELSPYAHVHAPHVIGYFRTSSTSFELIERPDGRTVIIERTSHELKLDPILYWLPLARWVVDQNNARVLAHIRRQAELSVVSR